MKNGKLLLNLEGEITPLTSNEENQLKGGFGTIATASMKENGLSNNDNCSNSSLSNNDNCKCDNCGKNPDPGEGGTDPVI